MNSNSMFNKYIQFIPNKNQVKLTFGEEKLTNDTANHMVMWSGGCDSTLLLYEVLTAGYQNVTAVSLKYPWLSEDKFEIERKHREAFIAEMRLRPDVRGFTHVEIHNQLRAVHTPLDRFDTKGGGLPQAVGWLLTIPMYARDGDYLYGGYIRNDDLILALPDYQDAVDSISNILGREIFLRLPYIFLTKAQVLEKLFKLDLYHLTWFCELPKNGQPCMHCHPCETHIAALLELAALSRDDKVSMRAKEELKKLNIIRESRLPVPSEIIPESKDEPTATVDQIRTVLKDMTDTVTNKPQSDFNRTVSSDELVADEEVDISAN